MILKFYPCCPIYDKHHTLLFTAWAFDRAGPERWVRWIFIAVGATVPLQLALTLGLLPPTCALPALGIWVIGLPLACLLLAALFRGWEVGTG